MNESEREKLEHLLARGRLSGGERERIFERALSTVAPPRSTWRRFGFVAWAPALAVLCAVAWFGLRRSGDGFRARGGGIGPLIELGCADGASDRCSRGATLVLRVAGATEGGYLVAWAEPIAGDGGARDKIWFLPTRYAAAAKLQASVAPQLVPDGFQIGPAQPPGRYVVHARLLRAPADQHDAPLALGSDVLAERVFPLEVTP
jgi:hypothetical protein